jgi:hypothetical protein
MWAMLLVGFAIMTYRRMRACEKSGLMSAPRLH